MEWTLPCHGGDHGFKSHTERHFLESGEENIMYEKAAPYPAPYPQGKEFYPCSKCSDREACFRKWLEISYSSRGAYMCNNRLEELSKIKR